MKKRKLLFCCLILLLSFFFFFYEKDDLGVEDNYYMSINHDILLSNSLENNEYSWSYFLDAQDRVDDATDTIVNDILDGNENDVIKDIYNKAIDIDKRNSYGISDLQSYLDMVWNVSSVSELIDAIIVLEIDLGIDILTNVEVMEDYKDNSKNIIYFMPVTFAFGANSDYIVNDDYMTYRAYLRRACVQLWKVYGKEQKEAREIVDRVFSFYEGVSNKSKLSGDLEDIVSYYQIVSEENIIDILSNVGQDYLSRRGLLDRDIYSMVDIEQYRYLNDSLVNDNVEVWKEVIITKILSSYAPYLSLEYMNVVNDLNKEIALVQEELSIEEQAIDLIKNVFASEIDFLYVNKYLDGSEKEEIMNMFFSLKSVYKERLKKNEWLSKEAIDKAIIKLDKMDIIIGNDVEGVDYRLSDNMHVSDGSLVLDIINMQQLIWKEKLYRLDTGKEVNSISQTVVNAYYQPLSNSVVIPAAFFELIDENSSYYEMLGTLGMILAHEIVHGFDSNGSQFDSDGNLNDWWSSDDKLVFERLQNDVSKYYSKYEVLDGKYIDGDKTVNENMADLGAIACISDLAILNGASKDELRLMFSSFAKLWASCESEEYMELLLLQDVHSPNQFRVNATLSSNDIFYEAYGIYPWDVMWVSKKNRVLVW